MKDVNMAFLKDFEFLFILLIDFPEFSIKALFDFQF